MLRMLARMQVSHVQIRRPRSIAADHVRGGGSLGATAPHVAQTIGAFWVGTTAPESVGEGVCSVTTTSVGPPRRHDRSMRPG